MQPSKAAMRAGQTANNVGSMSAARKVFQMAGLKVNYRVAQMADPMVVLKAGLKEESSVFYWEFWKAKLLAVMMAA